jgi:hypothetical protein
MEDRMLEYYASQGVMTDPGKYVDLYESLPDDVHGLVQAATGLLLHVGNMAYYKVELTEEREQEIQLRKAEDMLEKIMAIEDSPLVVARKPEKRLIINCRHFVVLACSFMRSKGIPVRARCGFANYMDPEPEWYADHWICEYWHTDQGRWIELDPKFDSAAAKELTIDVYDLPPERFLTGGEAWTLCRAGKLDPEKCGVFDPPHLKGLWFIMGNLIRDFMSLNKLELLPWDCNKVMEYTGKPLPEAECKIWDELAELTASVDERFDEVRKRYESDSTLRMPADWKP